MHTNYSPSLSALFIKCFCFPSSAQFSSWARQTQRISERFSTLGARYTFTVMPCWPGTKPISVTRGCAGAHVLLLKSGGVALSCSCRGKGLHVLCWLGLQHPRWALRELFTCTVPHQSSTCRFCCFCQISIQLQKWLKCTWGIKNEEVRCVPCKGLTQLSCRRHVVKNWSGSQTCLKLQNRYFWGTQGANLMQSEKLKMISSQFLCSKYLCKFGLL